MRSERLELTFKDVWEAKKTNAATVEYLVSNATTDMPLSKIYDGKGVVKTTTKDVLDVRFVLKKEAPNAYQFDLFLGHCSEIITQTKKKKHDDHWRYAELPTPSSFGQADSWIDQQEQPDKTVLCLRPNGKSFINPALMHPVFGVIADIPDSGEPQPEHWKLQADLLAIVANGTTTSRRNQHYLAKVHFNSWSQRNIRNEGFGWFKRGKGDFLERGVKEREGKGRF